ncbi:MAG: YciI family protein [Beijerinckiaceae bacterium]
MSKGERENGQKLAGRVYYIIFWDPVPGAGDRRAVHPQHIAKVLELEADGRLFAAGPFLGDDGAPDGRGMFILRLNSIEEAHAIAQADPYYKAGFRTYRVARWRRGEGAISLRVNVGANRVEID